MSKLTERVVTIISCDKRYAQKPYPSVPVQDSGIGTYLTGQHIDPEDPSTFNNLTMEEMTERVQLSAEKMKKFPFVIKPESKDENGKFTPNIFPIKHGTKLNITCDEMGVPVNQKDHALYNYYSKYVSVVSPSKEQMKKGTHYFYIEDKVAEANKRVSVEDQRFEAQSLVRSANLDKYREIALILNWKIKDFHMNVGYLTETEVKDILIQQCNERPADIISCFDKNINEDIFILKLKDKGILTWKNGAFYDGSLFVGSTLEQVKSFIKEDSKREYQQKWARLLESSK